MNWRERFPGVEVKTRSGIDGMWFDGSYTARATVLARLVDIERDEMMRRGRAAYRLESASRGAVASVMRQAAVDVLRFVKPDWSGFWGIGMVIVRSEGPGRVTKVNYLDKWFLVAWNHQQDQEQFTMADALLLVFRGEWRLS